MLESSGDQRADAIHLGLEPRRILPQLREGQAEERLDAPSQGGGRPS